MVSGVRVSLPPEGLPCSFAGSKEEGKEHLGSEGLGQGLLHLEGYLLLCIQLWSRRVSLCLKQDSPRQQRPQHHSPLQRRTAVGVLRMHFSGHLGRLH